MLLPAWLVTAAGGGLLTRAWPQRRQARRGEPKLVRGSGVDGSFGAPQGGSLRVLLVIHGYPPLYNAGSEVYTQTLAHALLSQGHQVLVFCREEDTIAPYFRIREEWDGQVPLQIINLPNFRDRYQVKEVDEAIAEVLRSFKPDVVHCGHLNHLSTSIVQVVARQQIPFIYTLHDFWLNCPRGQFIQFTGEGPDDLWPLCDGQENRKCAERCYAPRMASGEPGSHVDVDYWTGWIARRMAHVKAMADLVDVFVAPARHLMERFIMDGFAPKAKVVYLDYGFDRSRYAGRNRAEGEPFTFGYIGTHKESKGVQLLVEAFARLPSTSGARLKVFGRRMAQSTGALERLVQRLPGEEERAVEFCGEYDNSKIVELVFNHVDAIVVPSIWLENSPLVIHEAQQAGVLVITADVGGMAEYVEHERNGLLFKHRDADALAKQMGRCLEDPDWARTLGTQGYLHSADGQIPSTEEHVAEVVRIYRSAIRRRAEARVSQPAVEGAVQMVQPLWRLTLDTNPDDCNLHCDMCEGFSQYSSVAEDRRKQGLRSRRMDPDAMETAVKDLVDMNIEWAQRTGKCQALEVIPSTMGEPLLYAHFERLLAVIQREGQRLKDVLCGGLGLPHDALSPSRIPPGPWVGLYLNLTTNGTFPRLGAARWAELILPVASDIKISWNGAVKETQEGIMKGQNFDHVLENVRTLAEARRALNENTGRYVRITFQLTFLEENFEEVPDIVRLAAGLGVDRVKGHHLWAHWAEMAGRSMKRDRAAARRWNAMVPRAEAAAAEVGVLLEGVGLIPEDASEDLAPGAPCPFLGKEAWMSAEGRFNPCCAPDEQRLQLGYFGHLTERSLSEVVQSEPYQQLMATYSTRRLCLGCNMRRPPRHGAPDGGAACE